MDGNCKQKNKTLYIDCYYKTISVEHLPFNKTFFVPLWQITNKVTDACLTNNPYVCQNSFFQLHGTQSSTQILIKPDKLK